MDLVDSKKTHLPYNYFDLPVCESIEVTNQQQGKKNKKKFRKNLGQRLQGYNRKASPYEIISKKDMSCTTVCAVQLNAKQAKWLRFLIERQYRVYMSLDGLPVLMRSGDYGVRGFPGQKRFTFRLLFLCLLFPYLTVILHLISFSPSSIGFCSWF
jgi:transmembrane 9 superfamily protein 2/4